MLFTAARALEAQAFSLKSMELGMLSTISQETDPSTSKARFSNESMRNAELMVRKTTDKYYLAASAKNAAAELDVHEARVQLAFLSNEFSATKKLADLYAGFLQRRG